MPKVTNQKAPHVQAAPSDTNGRTGSHLRRNQACHQCRKRKSKCDAKRPCGTCMKTHAHYIAPLCARGEPFEPRPTCTYDDADDALDDIVQQAIASTTSSVSAQSAPIHYHTSPQMPPPQPLTTTFTDPSSIPTGITVNAELDFTPPYLFDRESRVYSFDMGSMPQASDFSFAAPSESPKITSVNTPSGSTSHGGPSPFSPADGSPSDNSPAPGSAAETPNSNFGYTDLIPSNYPASLPPPYIVEHLVDLFFTSIPLGNKILHRPTFLQCLRSPPGSKKYPSTTLLHAICATTSFVSPLIELPAMPDLSVRKVYEIFVPQSVLEEEHSLASGGRITFSLEQAVLARAMIELDVRTGRQPIMATTGLLILCWYYYANAQWADLWMQASILMRVNVALGLNCSGHYNSFSNPLALSKEFMGSSNDVAGQERLRNLFWASYMLDRQQHLATGWAPAITDEDISQELPARMDDYEAGIVVPGPRQHLSDPDLFTNHPPHLTDSWVLYVKTLVMLGRVGTFNRRLELHRRADINNGKRPPGQMFYPTNLLCDNSIVRLGYDKFKNIECSAEILASPQFKLLDNTITAFRVSVPAQYRDPFNNGAQGGGQSRGYGKLGGSVDVDGYMFHLGIDASIIVLHGPHVDMNAEVCLSRDRCLRAARSILDSVHALCATSFDVLLLPRPVMSMWECAVGVFSLFYCDALIKGQEDDAAMYKSEIEVFSTIIGRMGEKIPLAFKTHKGLATELENIVLYAREVRRHREQQKQGAVGV